MTLTPLISHVFSKDLGTKAYDKAVKEAEEALKSSKWRSKLLDMAVKATQHLGKGNLIDRQTSGETRALAATLQNWCK